MNGFVEINWLFFFFIQAFSRERGRHLSWWLKICMKWMDAGYGSWSLVFYAHKSQFCGTSLRRENHLRVELFPKFLVRYALLGAILPMRFNSGD